MTRRHPKVSRIRTLARDCGAAFLLTMSVLTALPNPTTETPPAIVRMARQSRGDFDEREWLTAATVLTVPLAAAGSDDPEIVHGQPGRDRLN